MTNITSANYREKQVLGYLLLTICCLLFFDIATDIFKETSILIDILLEGSILSCVFYAAFIVFNMLKRERSSSKLLEKDLISTKKNVFALKLKVKNYVCEFQKQLSIQLNEWHLSKSEKEIAIMLIQGKSTKEIAAIRNTSERTTRNQCQSIYEKSKLNGRHEFASFFFNELLEDINLDKIDEEPLDQAYSHINTQTYHQ